MIELLFTFLTIFIPIIITFMLCRGKNEDYIYIWFTVVFFILQVFHLVIVSLILSKYYYKNIIIWTDNDYQYIHSLPINPIKTINKTDYGLESEIFNNLKYSTKKTIIFYKRCLDNFYIKEDDCPITDIILEDNKINHPNYHELEINNDSYLYYSNNDKNEKLYFNNDSNIYHLNNNNIFIFNEYNEKEKLKEKEISNAIKNLKYFADYSDWLCLSFFLISFALTFINMFGLSRFYFMSLVIEIALFILYLIRFIKFIDLKNVFIKYKDFILQQYEYNSSKEYFPNKFFNIDSFAVALQINILLILILYTPMFENCLIKSRYLNKHFSNNYYFAFSVVFISIVLITNIIYSVNLYNNYKKLEYRYNNIYNNWELNPIYNISLSSINENNNYINWKNRNISFSRLNQFNYKNIYYDNKFTDSKICGKDSHGNDLYFPKNVECPINDIIITNDEYFDINRIYIKIKLEKNLFLYYTNAKTDGKIVNGLITSRLEISDVHFQDAEKENKTFLYVESYSKIDYNETLYLLSTHYFGINPEILSDSGKIKNFEEKIKKYLKYFSSNSSIVYLVIIIIFVILVVFLFIFCYIYIIVIKKVMTIFFFV